MLFTLKDTRKLCALLDRQCVGEECAQLRASKLVDRRTGQRLFFCGVAGEKGAWNPWACAPREADAPGKTGNEESP